MFPSPRLLANTIDQLDGIDNVWFYDMKSDRLSLDEKRTPQGKSDLPDILARWKTVASARNHFCFPISSSLPTLLTLREPVASFHDLLQPPEEPLDLPALAVHFSDDQRLRILTGEIGGEQDHLVGSLQPDDPDAVMIAVFLRLTHAHPGVALNPDRFLLLAHGDFLKDLQVGVRMLTTKFTSLPQ